jgi:predicted nicotinamide N-methyase
VLGRQDIVQERGLAGAQEAGQDGHGNLGRRRRGAAQQLAAAGGQANRQRRAWSGVSLHKAGGRAALLTHLSAIAAGASGCRRNSRAAAVLRRDTAAHDARTLGCRAGGAQQQRQQRGSHSWHTESHTLALAQPCSTQVFLFSRVTMMHGHAAADGGAERAGGGLLAQLHAERVARQPRRVATHALDASTCVSVVEQHGAQLGSSLWHSALPLCDWLYADARLRERGPRRILELGAGCGTCGIAAALAAGSAGGHTVVLTDKEEVCEHLQRNVAANAAAIQAVGSSVHVAPLLWRRQPPEDAAARQEWEAVKQHGPFDLLVACECVYELPLLAALIDTLAQAAAEHTAANSAGEDCCVIILGFCRRGGSLCPPEAVEEMLLGRFEHVAPPTTLARSSSAEGPELQTDSSGAPGTDTSTTFVYQMRLRT